MDKIPARRSPPKPIVVPRPSHDPLQHQFHSPHPAALGVAHRITWLWLSARFLLPRPHMKDKEGTTAWRGHVRFVQGAGRSQRRSLKCFLGAWRRFTPRVQRGRQTIVKLTASQFVGCERSPSVGFCSASRRVNTVKRRNRDRGRARAKREVGTGVSEGTWRMHVHETYNGREVVGRGQRHRLRTSVPRQTSVIPQVDDSPL